jgi:hypothetical protein
MGLHILSQDVDSLIVHEQRNTTNHILLFICLWQCQILSVVFRLNFAHHFDQVAPIRTETSRRSELDVWYCSSTARTM